MDLFKLGLRDIVGVTLPGAMLILILFYVLFSGALALDHWMIGQQWTKDQQFLNFVRSLFHWTKDKDFVVLVALFLVSYNLGSLMRLNSADKVDKLSSKCNLKTLRPTLEKEGYLKAKKDILIGNFENIPGPHKHFYEWLWNEDSFPYPAWQLMKLKLYHPPAMLAFFQKYQDKMTGKLSSQGNSTSHDNSNNGDNERYGKEFFNYCKTVICHTGPPIGEALVHEVHYAEATVRFFAGTWYGLEISIWVLASLLIFQSTVLFGQLTTFLARTQPAFASQIANTVATGMLLFAVYRIRLNLVKRFRTLRLKEVDTVYDAFYLVHQHCPTCKEAPSNGSAVMAELESDDLKAVTFVEAEAERPVRVNPAERQEPLRLSETRLAFYLLVSGIMSFSMLRLLTNQEMVVALGTLSLAIVGMWILAFWNKARLLNAALKHR